MKTIDILQKIDETLIYLQKRKQSVFEEIQQVKKELETVISTINEQEAYMNLESNREKMERNIFSIYNTSEKYEKEKERIRGMIEKKNTDKKRLETTLKNLSEELETVNDRIVSNQILEKHFLEEKEKQKEETLTETVKLDIANQLQFCLSILELDKERCAMELQKLLEFVQS